MLTDEFDYVLPAELIASYPASSRTDSRLLHLNYGTGALTDYQFADVIQLINPGDLLVVNDSRVLQARLSGRKETGDKVEVLIERIISDNEAWVQIYASEDVQVGTWLVLADDIRSQVREHDVNRNMYLLSFHYEAPILDILASHGEVPLPLYMNRNAEAEDKDRYQTVYSDSLGSVVALAAGLHFSQPLLFALQNKGVELGRLTLHVGAGTFNSVTTEHIEDHTMHSERLHVSAQLCDQIAATKARGGRVICVGATSVRSLEAAALGGNLQPKAGDTDIFITPGFQFKVVDALITNFHVPKSTILMLISAFAGTDKVFIAYKHAIDNKYRFYSYGDAMFISGA